MPLILPRGSRKMAHETSSMGMAGRFLNRSSVMVPCIEAMLWSIAGSMNSEGSFATLNVVVHELRCTSLGRSSKLSRKVF
mmetsp:Transcript_11488/g.24328  ORF Transcript_11488/g.24328 Transcript_11488/m.24328 type:complete len:80 (+) Transcript_11488:353-592(+)